METRHNLIFIHGLMGSSQGDKATWLRSLYPDILTPDFRGSLEERMQALINALGEAAGWTMIGSSFGGLMAAIFACQHPRRVEKLVLLAPALVWPEFAADPPTPVDIPVTIFHGIYDEVIPLEALRPLAGRVFHNLTLHVVEDDHGLYKTVRTIDWQALLELPADGAE